MSELTTTTSADELLPEIVKQHRAASEHVRQAVASAIRVGELLVKAKSLVRRGEWQDWLANNCPFAETTAQGYMRLARLPEENRNALRDSSLRAALDAIAAHHERAIADESKTIDGEAEEVEPSDEVEVLAPEEDEDTTGDAGVEDAVILDDELGRTPEQKARDIAANAIHNVIQECHWKNVDRMLALQTLIKLLTEELKQTVVPLSAEETAEARKAAYAATEADDAPAGSQQVCHSGCQRHQVATSGHSHVCLAQKPFLLVRSRRLTRQTKSITEWANELGISQSAALPLVAYIRQRAQVLEQWPVPR